MVIHALTEALDIGSTRGVLVGLGSGVALPKSAVHGLGIDGSGLLRLSRGAGAAEHTTDGVADGGTDCDTTVGDKPLA